MGEVGCSGKVVRVVSSSPCMYGVCPGSFASSSVLCGAASDLSATTFLTKYDGVSLSAGMAACSSCSSSCRDAASRVSCGVASSVHCVVTPSSAHCGATSVFSSVCCKAAFTMWLRVCFGAASIEVPVVDSVLDVFSVLMLVLSATSAATSLAACNSNQCMPQGGVGCQCEYFMDRITAPLHVLSGSLIFSDMCSLPLHTVHLCAVTSVVPPSASW